MDELSPPDSLLFHKAKRGFILTVDTRGSSYFAHQWAFTTIEEVAEFFLAHFGNKQGRKWELCT